MVNPPELPPRPLPSRSLFDRIGVWLRWFGLARLVATAVSVVVVVAGGVWLLHAPAPSTEAGLPMVGSTPPGTSPATLPEPSAPPTSDVVPSITAATRLVIHVAGAVNASGVYDLPAGARVADAVAAAGGAAGDADLDGLNLAATMTDGQRVYVPRVGEVDPALVPNGATPSGSTAAATSEPAFPLDLNGATAEQLEHLPGVGPATAAAIVGDRDVNGPFASVDDLDRVAGIGPAKLAALRDLVTV
jgi:competence protein ComEA